MTASKYLVPVGGSVLWMTAASMWTATELPGDVWAVWVGVTEFLIIVSPPSNLSSVDQ